MSRDEIIARIRAIKAERTSLVDQLAEKMRELTDAQAARDRLQAFIDTPDWGALDSGAAIAAGDVLRFGALSYEARVDHAKALTRSPLNPVYWAVREV